MFFPQGLQGVIFDFDGVLVDSEPMHEQAILTAVRPLGWTFTREQFTAHIVGRGDERALHSIAGWHGATLSETEALDLLAIKRAAMTALIHDGRFEAQPGALELVALASANFPTGVCSGSRRSVVEPMLKKLDLLHVFKCVVTADDVGRPKPWPDGYLHALDRLQTLPGRTLAIEDTPAGVRAARAAGLRVIAVSCTVPPAELNEADRVVDSMGSLQKLLPDDALWRELEAENF